MIGSLVAALIGAAIGGWIGSRRWRLQKRFETVAETIWTLLETPAQFEIATPEQRELIALVDRLDDIDTDDIERHFLRLGDLVMTTTDASPLRVFVDESRTVLAHVEPGSTHVVFSLESYTDTDEFVTTRSPVARAMWTLPPFSHQNYLPPSTTLEELITSHRQLSAQAERSLLRITTLEAARDQFQNVASRSFGWRMAQPPDELLATDLKALLGEDGFARNGAAWIKHFRKRHLVPRAVVRTRA